MSNTIKLIEETSNSIERLEESIVEAQKSVLDYNFLDSFAYSNLSQLLKLKEERNFLLTLKGGLIREEKPITIDIVVEHLVYLIDRTRRDLMINTVPCSTAFSEIEVWNCKREVSKTNIRTLYRLLERSGADVLHLETDVRQFSW